MHINLFILCTRTSIVAMNVNCGKLIFPSKAPNEITTAAAQKSAFTKLKFKHLEKIRSMHRQPMMRSFYLVKFISKNRVPSLAALNQPFTRIESSST